MNPETGEYTLFDTHAHLNDPRFDPDREEVLRLCEKGGVARIIEIADSPAEWDKAIALSRARPSMIRCSLGLHPYHADQWRAEVGTNLLEKARLDEVVAVGEIGLDYAKCPIPRDVQKRTFLEMLDVSARCELPVVIHCREAYEDMMPLLKDFCADKQTRRFRGVLHCFSGSREDALTAVSLGFALGVDGPVTYPKNDALREAIVAAGLESIVLETDSPYLPPQSARGKRNDPRFLKEIAQGVASLFHLTFEAIVDKTSHNAEDLFS